MTDKEFDKIIDNNRFSSLNALGSTSPDKFKAFIKQVYYDGFRAGFRTAIGKLELLADFGLSMSAGGAYDDYWDRSEKRIKRTLEAVRDFTESGDDESSQKTDG